MKHSMISNDLGGKFFVVEGNKYRYRVEFGVGEDDFVEYFEDLHYIQGFMEENLLDRSTTRLRVETPEEWEHRNEQETAQHHFERRQANLEELNSEFLHKLAILADSEDIWLDLSNTSEEFALIDGRRRGLVISRDLFKHVFDLVGK